jgi:sugar phosphate isomerase/epimerase
MRVDQIAAQLYTIREYITTPEEIAKSLKRVRAIGYTAVQVSGMGPIGEEELVKILDGEGLTCASTHEDSETILSSPDKVVERLNKLGCKNTAYPYPSGISFDSVETVRGLAAGLNRSGKVLHDAGMVLCYHNHHLEFQRLVGRPVLDILYSDTDPRYLQAEIDTYWVQAGGGEPTDWCRRLKGRLPVVHLKDYALGCDLKPVFAEVGNGNLNWHTIIPAAQESGCEWFIVEQDICPGDPFESLKVSFEYLRENFAQG